MKKILVFTLLLLSSNLFSDDADEFRAAYSFFKDGYYDLAEINFKEFVSAYEVSIYSKKAFFYLALSQLEQRKFENALSSFLSLKNEKEFEYFDEVEYYLALLYGQTGDYQNSLKYIEKINKTLKETERIEKLAFLEVQNLLKLGNMKGSLEKSKEYFENSSFKRYKKEVSKILINRFMETKDFYNASKVLEAMLFFENEDESKKAIFHNYILCLKELKQFNEAKDFFKKNVNYFDKSLYEMVSDIYYDSNDKEDALNILKQIFYRDKSFEILKKIVTIYLEQDRIKDAVLLLEEENRDIELSLILSELYYKEDKIKESYNILSSIDLNSFKRPNLIIFFKICLELNKKNDFKKYIDRLDKLMILSPDERENLLYKLGEIFYNDSEYRNSNVVLKRYLTEYRNGENYEKILFMYGVSLKNDKRYDDSIVEFSKIHKSGKKDEIYYEAFTEKGEIYFILQEYKNAVESYKQYLNNKKYDARKKEVLLQLGNAYFNIKNYNLAYDVYRQYLLQYEDNEVIQSKIAYSLLKIDNYAEIISFFSKKDKIYDFQKYLLVLSHYKLKDYVKAIEISNAFLEEKSSKYAYDIAYINLSSRVEINDFNEIDSLYDKTRKLIEINDQKSLAMKKEFFRIYVREGKTENALKIFPEEKDIDIVFFIGETFYKNLYLEKSSFYFKKIFESKEKFEKNELASALECFILQKEYAFALEIIDYLLREDKNDVALNFKKADIILKDFDLEYKTQNISNNRVLEYFNAKKEYILKNKYSEFKNLLTEKLNDEGIEDIYGRKLLLEFVRLQYERGDHKEVINRVNKIPEKVINTLTAEFKFLLAQSYLRVENEKRALMEFLKIFYLYPYDNYFVEAAIKEVLKIYEKNGEIKKHEKTLKMFEEKYFKIH